MIYKTIY